MRRVGSWFVNRVLPTRTPPTCDARLQATTCSNATTGTNETRESRLRGIVRAVHDRGRGEYSDDDRASHWPRLVSRGSWGVAPASAGRRESFESEGVPSVVRPLFFVPPRSVARGSEPARRSAQSVLTRKSPCALSGNDPMRRSFPTGAKYAKFDETQNRCSGHAPWMVNIEEIRRLPPWKPRRE